MLLCSRTGRGSASGTEHQVRYRARLAAQGAAIGLVALLFILLAWSLLHDEGGDLSKQANRGDRPSAPDFTLDRLDRDGKLQLE